MRWLRLGMLAASVVAAVGLGSGSRADDYPNKPVHIIVGFIPGSAAHITAQVLGTRMGQILGKQFVVEAKPGAGSSLAADYSAKATPDGYTLFLGSSANITNTALDPKLTDISRDLTPIALATTVPVILVVNPSSGINSVAELIALAKSKPGEVLYASTGVGTAPHLAAELFAQRAGVKLVHVPYQGSPQAVTDLLAGRTTMMFSPASAVLGQVEAGKLKALASAAAKRPDVAQNIPTMAEAGMPDFDTSIWFGLMAPNGTPHDIVDKLTKTLLEAQQSPEVLAALKKGGFDIISGGPAEFKAKMQSESKRWADVAVAAGLKK
ncbi:MAG TPA: tripartite tricarboxylate transporter substrate-binding protein [Xanthobacteraceae bacterium]|nr:tripartite tricarboxylate transporter substrate-binding protein [Xanthobacteraceae bacterium]